MLAALVLAALGLAAIVGSEVLARRYAPRYVIGRILVVAPQVSLAEALDMAERDDSRYIRIHGRIASEEEFPDENDRPLVFRRKRIDVRAAGRGWRTVAEEVEGVPFGVEARGIAVTVDSASLNEGLIVLPRESIGRVGDLPAEIAPADLDPATPARLVIEQISAVEHAFVAGVPRRGGEAQVVMSNGRRRPLILTTLDVPAAMRVLAVGQRGLVALLAVLLAVGAVLLISSVVVGLLALI